LIPSGSREDSLVSEMDSDVCAASISRVSDNFMNAGVHSLDGEGQAESDGTVGCV
jgi:hypothetical protein